MKLSRRLQAIANLVPITSAMADIGSDHAYLPIYLVQQQIVQTAFATEVAPGPLAISKKDIQQAALTDQIKPRFGNGLQALKASDVVQTAVIAGMGGQLIQQILEQGAQQLATIKYLVLEPNNDEFQVRQWLDQNQFAITAETIVQEGRHTYEIMQAQFSGSQPQLTTEQLLFGPILLQEKSITFKNKWQQQLKRSKMMYCNLKNAKQPQKQKLMWAQQRIQRIEEVLR